jgi:hypothetical protein
MIVFVTLLVLAILFIACTLIALITENGKWVDRFLIGFVVFIFAALLSLGMLLN